MITIIDYGMGNLGSIENMLKKVGVESCITSNHDLISKAEKLILPGVGHFDAAMRNLKSLELLEPLNEQVIVNEVPILGICLGMQLFAEESEEGVEKGLGWVRGKVKKFNFNENPNRLRIPHMGWNTVIPVISNRIINNINKDAKFYFVHTYHFDCYSEDNILLQTHYGYEFTSAIIKKNIMGVQFHPEKSHKYGMVLLNNFANS